MTASPQTRVTTDDAGIPAASDEHSLTAGADGPILLSDHYLIQKMAQFNRERVPERVVHAKGAGAFGTFRVTGDVSHLTKAHFLQPGRETPMLARFSTVAGEQGFPDTVRDPRGFSLKFYTQEGNYDLVGNNTPVFFVRDPSKFQDFIRSQKRRADTGLRDNNMQWDFWTLSPESSHQVTILMSDRGIPRTLRHMNGYGSHTFLWENAAGEKHWVKYHFKTDQGVETFSDDEAAAMAGEDGDFHRRDLADAIKAGEFPTWTAYVQAMPFEDAVGYKVNPFDVTKTVSQKDYPLIEVGTMTLDRNPENYFAQIEQSSFEPSNLVPGIGPSPDRMLIGRLFSYPDAHRYRIGANYLQLPVNAPVSPVNSYNKDGAMRYSNPSDPVYAPNSFGGPQADPAYAEPGWHVSGEIMRAAATLHAEDDDTTQAGTLVREVMDDTDREHLVANIVGHASDAAVTAAMKPRIVEYWRAIDPGIGAAVEKELLGA
ncbi:catalase [Geodermatophilaceae bacterium NBWT11]|nr:catalase [Geodermatophilaceae bacterium NBWT11]